ncbi:MAG: 3-methyl-2-oxobutanoate hydroxymethyltransferase [Cenarchaeum symbiont of Oopsacas minuta]|nr:3-methyl-2-oxobutanoate hydroxymethyltransferase [Cenarchaeum symbiont of Oopsacas minuta]
MHKSIMDIVAVKNTGKKITVLTSFDHTFASMCDAVGIDILLVGDSAGMVALGYDDTTKVTMDQMCLFTRAVSRARKNALIVSDMPFMSYQPGLQEAVRNAGMLISAGADAVKVEGGAHIVPIVRELVETGIPVMGHIGVQPQTATMNAGYTAHGMTKESALDLIADADKLAQAGIFALTLEMVAAQTANIITERIPVPTIGIGSGPKCDGQVLVTQDMLGMYEKINTRFIKRYLDREISEALGRYCKDVQDGIFPNDENSYLMDSAELKALDAELGKK